MKIKGKKKTTMKTEKRDKKSRVRVCDCRRAATDNAERRYVGKVLNAEKRV